MLRTKKILYFIALVATLCVFSVLNAVHAQNNRISLRMVFPKEINKETKNIRTQQKFQNKNEAFDALQKNMNVWIRKGFLTVSIDSIYEDSLTVNAFINPGNKFIFDIKNVVGLENETEKKIKKKIIKAQNYYDILSEADKAIVFFEKNGYPFASFFLDSINIYDKKIDAIAVFQKNNKIVFDSLIIKGNAKITNTYLTKYLGIKKGNPYNEMLVGKISQRIKNLPFVNETKPAEILFTEKDAKLFLYLNKKKANSFHGIVGVLPNNNVTGKMLINGELKLYLLNAFGRGELIDLNWRSISKNTQDLKLNFNYPYIFNTSFGIDYHFTLFKQDTSYLSLYNNIGIQYYFQGRDYLKGFTEIHRSDLLSSNIDTNNLMPDFADLSANMFGIEYCSEIYDYRINPQKGYRFLFSFAGGQKRIRKNTSLSQDIYENIGLKTSQYKITLKGLIFLPVLTKTTLLINTENAYLINKNIFENELFRLGGLRSLRGFDEESIKASYYNLLLVEFRYLFERNSFVSIFANGAYYEKKTPKKFLHDTPYGFGVGTAFDTKLGMFSIYYALGSQFGQGLSLRQSKIHFGYTNTF